MRANDRPSTNRRWKLGGIACLAGPGLLLALGIGTAWFAGPAHAESPATRKAAPKEDAIVEPPRQPSAAEILQELMKRQQPRPAIMPSRPGVTIEDRLPTAASEPTVNPSRQERPLLPDGSTLADRVGRLVRRGNAWFLAFESEGKVLRESPLQILPNRDLEIMEIASANGTRPVKFRVSGEVTEYRGANYLMLRKVLIVQDLGNFK